MKSSRRFHVAAASAAALLLPLLALPLPPHALAGPVSHGPRQAGEEVLDELLLGKKTVAAKVGSNGCTGKGSFRVDVRKGEGMTPSLPHYVLTIERVAPDECKAIVGGGDGPVILWDTEKELGLSGSYTFSVANRVRNDTPPSEWGDEERSPVSIVREHLEPKGAAGEGEEAEGAVPGGSPAAEPRGGAASPDGGDRYEGLVARLKGGDRNVDFTALRMAYAETDGYMPYGGDGIGKEEAFEAMRRREYAEAAELAEEGLEENYADLDLHRLCRAAYGNLGDRGREELHDFVLEGLLDSLRSSGDGGSPGTAIVVVSEAEEDGYLQDLELKAVRSETVEIGGHWYDKVEAQHLYLKSNLSTTFYFNVDIPQAWLKRGPRDE